MSNWTKFATKFYQQQKKKNPDYRFSQALKDGAKVYKKRGGGEPKIVGGEGEGDEPIKNKAIDDINACTTKDELEDLALLIDELVNSDTEVKAALEKKMEKFEEVPVEDEVPPSIGSEEVKNMNAKKVKLDAADEEVMPPSIGSEEVTNMNAEALKPAQGGKKAKKSAKKGKKSVKKGGKKARKSAKKSRR
jgi:hypothetical protein